MPSIDQRMMEIWYRAREKTQLKTAYNTSMTT